MDSFSIRINKDDKYIRVELAERIISHLSVDMNDSLKTNLVTILTEATSNCLIKHGKSGSVDITARTKDSVICLGISSSCIEDKEDDICKFLAKIENGEQCLSFMDKEGGLGLRIIYCFSSLFEIRDGVMHVEIPLDGHIDPERAKVCRCVQA